MSRPIITSDDGLFMLLEGIVNQCKKDIKRDSKEAKEAREVLDYLGRVLTQH